MCICTCSCHTYMCFYISRYRYEDRSAVGASSLPVCHTFQEAEEQYSKEAEKRENQMEEAGAALQEWQEEEAERMFKVATEEEIQREEKEKKEHEDAEVCIAIHKQRIYIDVFLLNIDALILQMKQRGTKQPRKVLTRMEKFNRDLKYVDFVDAKREAMNSYDDEEMEKTSAKIDTTMKMMFSEYVPLKYHLQQYQITNLRKQYCKETPPSELSVYNLYLGGENQTEEKFNMMTKRQASSVAREMSDISDDE